jgi:predicted GNAT family N-acyltransferase
MHMAKMIRYREISTKDPEYKKEKELRDSILRKPLGLSLSEKDIQGEENQTHLLAMENREKVIGCLLIVFAEGNAKIRQLAVAGKYQKQGIGTELMKRAEAIIYLHNIRNVWLNARYDVVGFYEPLGYEVISDIFMEVTIKHVKMKKLLPSA